MRHTFFSIITIGLILCSTPLLHAGAGRTAAQFLSLGGATRAAALGDAFAAVSGDTTAVFWNPSGLYGIEKAEAILAYTDYSGLFGEAGEGLYYSLFAGALPVGDWGVIATTLQVNGQGVIEITRDSPEVLGQENLGTNWAWALAYSDEFFPNFLGGATVKLIKQKLGPESGQAFAVDLGAQYHLKFLPLPISLGASVKNWGTRIHFKDENQSDPLPRTFQYGVSLTLLKSQYQRFQILGDFTAAIDKFRDDEEELNDFVNNLYGDQKENPEKFWSWWGEEVPFKTQEDIRGEVEARRGIGINAFRYSNMLKSLGAEYRFGDERIALALRMGYKNDPYIIYPSGIDKHFTYGIGIMALNYQLDYASVPGGGPENKRLNTFALLIRF